jgi:hypothetical protein
MAVFAHMMLAGFFRVMYGMHMVAVSDVGVMAGGVVIAGFVVVSRKAVVLSGVFVVLRCFAVMFRGFLRHGGPPGKMLPAARVVLMTKP